MSRKRGVFITGTDTGVGKTIVAATLARLMKLRGINVGVMKPVTSGCLEKRGLLVSDDAELLCWASGLSCCDNIAPYLLREPLSPLEAARLDGVTIDLGHIKKAYDNLVSKYDFVIVEGAGGLLTPLAENTLTTELVRILNIPLAVVARPSLGTVNHSLLTCYCAQRMNLVMAGVIINSFPETPGLAEQSAPRQIEAFSGAPLLGVWPAINNNDQFSIVATLTQWLIERPETNAALKKMGA